MIYRLLKNTFFLLLIFLASSCTYNKEVCDVFSERDLLAQQDINWLYIPIENLPSRLTLYDMIEIASNRNLELFVQAQQWNIQNEKTNRDLFALLPQFNYDTSYTRRNKNTAATAALLNSPGSNIPYEIGVPKHEHTWNYTFLWNAIDFGVTFFRSQQDRDQTLIEAFEYERIRQSVILRVVQAYWRAVAAKKSVDRANALLPDMLSQTQKLNREIKNKVYLTKDQGLEKLVFFYQREIELKGFNDRPDSSDPTQGYDKEYENALLDLSQLMQLPPNVRFDIDIPDELPYEAEIPELNHLFEIALVNRPELFEKDLAAKIGAEDAYQALVQALPGLQLFISQNHDSNQFLLFKNWYSAGMNIAWNLLALPVHYEDYLIGKEEEVLARRQRLLQSEGIITQVAITYLLFIQNQEQYLLAKQWADTSLRLSELSQKEANVGKKSKLEALQSQIDAALAQNNASKIYTELQNNLEQLNNAIGIPLYFKMKKLGKLTLANFEEVND